MTKMHKRGKARLKRSTLSEQAIGKPMADERRSIWQSRSKQIVILFIARVNHFYFSSRIIRMRLANLSDDPEILLTASSTFIHK